VLSILVGHAYFLRFDRKQLERRKPYPPLATLQAAALVRALGHRVSLFDAMLAEDCREYERQLRRLRPQVLLLYEDNYNFLSKMCLGAMRQAARRMIRAAHRLGARVIVAGSDATDAPRIYLAAGAEAVLAGEGLGALATLIGRLDAQPHLAASELVDGVSGVASASSGAKPLAPHRAAAPAIAQIPAPAWDLLDIERYRSIWRAAHGYFSLNMAASRGCSFRCAWCAKPIWGNQYLQRSAADVAAEMSFLKRQFAPDHIWFADDVFGFRVDWVSAFAAAADAAGGPIPFTIQTRADLVSERMAAALHAAGCREAWLGAESGSQRVLDAMNKGTTVAQIHAARARLARAGIRVGFFIQLGYLGEELADILATRELLERAAPDDVGVSVAYPLPGTRFYELVSTQLGKKTHWRASGELSMMFHGTYNSAFYRAVRDLLHDEVKLNSRGGACDEAERRALAQRWDQLLARESHCRNPPLAVRTDDAISCAGST
jgi:anaerobic magnesium-protoporphyrin IX monomethyl ester cyclase